MRVTLGTVLLFIGLFLLAERSLIGAIVAVVGLIALATGIARFCGLYLPFGISTARTEGQTGQASGTCCGSDAGGAAVTTRDKR